MPARRFRARAGELAGPSVPRRCTTRSAGCASSLCLPSATPFQIAIAAGLRLPDPYFHQLAADYQTRRDFLMGSLAACGLKPTRPAGGFFILTDISSFPASSGREFCHDLAKDFGVVPVPTDTFYLHQNYGERIARFTFCLRRETLETAARRLAKLRIA